MIPSIEDIVEGLHEGKYTKSECVRWLHQHSEQSTRDYRQDIALSLLTGMLCNGFSPVGYEGKTYIEIAYAMADDFIKAAA